MKTELEWYESRYTEHMLEADRHTSQAKMYRAAADAVKAGKQPTALMSRRYQDWLGMQPREVPHA